jgi:YVTN family beta-propeller protein
VIATVTVGVNSVGVAVSPDGTRAYVVNATDNSVSVINTTTNTVVATVNVGHRPIGVAFAPDGSAAYVTNALDNTV